MKSGTITFAGAGPGAVDLLTLRCRDAIAEADVIVFAGSLVNPEVLQFASDNAEIHDSAGLNLQETTALLIDASSNGKKALRLHTGDPSMYGAIAEQIAQLEKANVPYEVIPGVSSVFAASATLGKELTLPGSSQTVILTRRAGRTPVPKKQDIESLASHNATMGIFLSVSDMPGLINELKSGGYSDDTPVSVVYRASWPDEKKVSGTLSDIASLVADADITRQALVLVGDALAGNGEESKLYDADFSHGYRNASERDNRNVIAPHPQSAPFLGKVAVYGLTESGCNTARKISHQLGADAFISDHHSATDDSLTFDPKRISDLVEAQWNNYDAHILVMAMGIATRKTASLLRDKTIDPAVVVCDECGQFAISVAGGHIGGGNRLTHDIASAIGATAVITTATDAQGIQAFDEIASLQGWSIINPKAIKAINTALIQKKIIGFFGPEYILEKYYADHSNIILIEDIKQIPERIEALVTLDSDDIPDGPTPVLQLESEALIAGIGCRKDTSAEEIANALSSVLDKYGLSHERIKQIATATAKENEPGLLEFAKNIKLSISFYSSDELKEVSVPTPSRMPEKHIGTPSVAEASAILHSKGRLIVPKQICNNVTIAVAVMPRKENPEQSSISSGRIAAVGIGSGAAATITPQAREALNDADVIVGYKTYIDQVAPIITGKRILSSGMRQEEARCKAAIEEAKAGHSVAVICSGDAGVYGMAGLLLELLEGETLDLYVVPGITAALTAAASLGAPLMNDFAIISLSDLLTEREVIIERLRNVASCGMPCALYNPRSKKRHDLFNQALEIFSSSSDSNLACGMVKNAGRTGETIWVGSINNLPITDVDMFTVVIIGGRHTEIIGGRLVTRRGYQAKHK